MGGRMFLPAPSNPSPVAVNSDIALATQGGNGFTQILSESNKEVIVDLPVSPGEFFPKGLFRFFRCLRMDIAPAVRDAVDMGIHTYPGLIVPNGHHKIGGLTPHSLQLQEILYLIRDP